jgi:hypothetical protein
MKIRKASLNAINVNSNVLSLINRAHRLTKPGSISLCQLIKRRLNFKIKVDLITITTFVFNVCCGSEFELNNGTAVKKPAILPLKQYFTSYDEQQKILYISNTPF